MNWLVFIPEKECVYCAVRTESLNNTEYLSSLGRFNTMNKKIETKFLGFCSVTLWLSVSKNDRSQRTVQLPLRALS